MELLNAKVPANCDIVLHGDSHDGSKACHRNGIEQVLDFVMEKPNRFFVHMGDETESITVDDNRRYNSEISDIPIPLQQSRAVVAQYKRASKRCLAWLNGNHNDHLRRFGNLTRDIVCHDLGVPYGTYTAKLKLWDNRGQIVKMFLWHGPGRGSIQSRAKDWEQQQANMLASLKRYLVHKASDCLIMAHGHVHKLLLCPPANRLLLYDDGDKVKQCYMGAGAGTDAYIEPDRRWYVCTGSFLRMYLRGVDTYAEMGGYDPVQLGYVVVEIRDRIVSNVRAVVVD
jgi:hypothetical protein